MTVRAQAVNGTEEFVSRLDEADVRLFDKLAPLNRLVQWGDNRPVGHCGVWHSGGVFEAVRETDSAEAQSNGIRHPPLSELLGRTVIDGRGAT
jgi:hypothetical protein